ncbi:hypothetical protein GF373_01125 [bacterium]|nr:hypothetical protein [bacterium]
MFYYMKKPSFYLFCTLPFLLCCIACVSIHAQQDASLAFQSAGDGVFTFNTGAYKGVLHGSKKPQGLRSLVDGQSGMEISKLPGLLCFYRLLSVNQRWERDFRERDTAANLLADGALQVTWSPEEDYPIELIATYKWKAKNILDLGITFTPTRMMRDVEVFLSSYFNKKLKGYVYADKTFMLPGKPAFLPADVKGPADFLYGTYLAFPRDPRAAQIIYDGRWEKGLHPVHFSVTRFYKYPLFVKKDPASGTSALLMARPEDCFSLEMSYNREPADNIANHSSVYFSLFGEDLRAGETRHTTIRLVLGNKIEEQEALRFYHEYLDDVNESSANRP